MSDNMKVYIKKKMKQYYIFSIVFFVCFIVFNVAIPKIYVNVVIKDEDSIPKDLGVLRYRYYAEAIENATTEVEFDQVFIENRWAYYSKEFDTETLYDIKVTPREISDLGVIPKGWPYDLMKDPLEYLYGTSYTSSNEIVITDRISMQIYNKVDSVGETLDISDQTFVVTGVVKEHEDIYYDVFISDETVIDKTDMYLLHDDQTYVYIMDDELVSKLYALGGMDLVDVTMTMNNQTSLNIYVRIIINWMNTFLIAIYIIIRFKTIRHARFLSGPVSSFKICIRSCQNVSWAILIFLMLSIMAIGASASYKVALIYMFEHILGFYYLLYIYMIPLIFYAIREFKYAISMRQRKS